MKLVSALVCLAALGTVTFAGAATSAMPVAVADQPAENTDVVRAAYVCNGWGHCWHQPGYAYGYYHPRYDGGWGWHRGWGDGWHPWHRWHHWHHWHYWRGW